MDPERLVNYLLEKIDTNIIHNEIITRIVKYTVKVNNVSITDKVLDYLNDKNINSDIILPLHQNLYKNNVVKGVENLIMYYYQKNALKKRFKYLNIGWYKYKSKKCLIGIIQEYSVNKDFDNLNKYYKFLNEIDKPYSEFIIGIQYKYHNKFDKMIEHFKLFLECIDKNLLLFDKDEISEYENAYSIIIHTLVGNEIDLKYVQTIYNKFNIKSKKLMIYLQLKINKTKLSDYCKIGECSTCLDDDVNMQMFDCLNHHYCRNCTIQLLTCPKCTIGRISF